MGDPADDRFLESDLVRFLVKLVSALGTGTVRTEARDARNMVVDLVVEEPGRVTLVEVKKPVPQTPSRLDGIAAQLGHYAQAARAQWGKGRELKLVLAIPGTLAPDGMQFLADKGIEVWDGPWMAAQATRAGMAEEAACFVSAESFAETPVSEEQGFAEQLRSLPAGKAHWAAYQRLCKDILDYLFCPPLSPSVSEISDGAAVNRRDLIYPNYADSGFWHFMRREYRADYVVVDAKNYVGPVKKPQVLQMANYLTRHGTGLFGVIVCRKGADRGAAYTLREQWVLHDKLIVILDDRNVLQMLNTRLGGNTPDEVVRQKIEDFRLKI
ncbi:hypothetical protein [Streptomyces sp. NPDC058773]|uniref:hypothetical protein n=1 Tax=Streptomyces sp. NPDC058773 TaxID=3346632 RepID=UPI0036A59BE5